MQTFIVIVIVASAAGYALWRIYDNFRHGGDPCRDCAMKQKCLKNGQISSRNDCHCK